MSEPTEGQFLKLIRDYGQKVHQSSPTPYLYQTPGSTPMHDYAELALQGKFAEAEKISATLQPVREVSAKWMRAKWVEQNLIPIAYIKAWSEMLGMAGGPVRPACRRSLKRNAQLCVRTWSARGCSGALRSRKRRNSVCHFQRRSPTGERRIHE